MNIKTFLRRKKTHLFDWIWRKTHRNQGRQVSIKPMNGSFSGGGKI